MSLRRLQGERPVLSGRYRVGPVRPATEAPLTEAQVRALARAVDDPEVCWIGEDSDAVGLHRRDWSVRIIT